MRLVSISLIVGLGNPGTEYAQTRHNAGFWYVERLAQRYGISLKSESRFHGLTGRGQIEGHDVRLLLPSTFMNRSGQAVVPMAKFFQFSPAQLLIAHDELDLASGVIRLKSGGGHGGHNGLKDIAAALGTPDFWRLRLGIGHPGDRNEVVNFVLKAASKDEQTAINQCIDDSLQVATQLLNGDFEGAMLKLHTKK